MRLTRGSEDLVTLEEQEEKLKKEHFLDILENAQQLSDWVYTYLGIRLPSDTIDPDSNSNPINAMWEIYEAVKLNKGEDIPGYIMLSAREAYKTLSSSILEVLILTHFQLSIAHMAAISSQSNKAISYIQSFLVKLKPYYDYHGWTKVGDSKTRIQFQTPQGNSPYITVVICTLQGANCIAGDSILELENGKTIRAAEVFEGLKIKTWDYRNQKDVYVVSKGVSLVKKHARKLIFSNGSEIILSDDHLVFTQNGWVFADSVKLGDKFKSSGLISKSFAIKKDHYQVFDNEKLLSYRANKGLTVDSGEWFCSDKDKEGFSYSKEPTGKLEKDLFKQVKDSLNIEVTKIELLGLQELVDIHIDNEDPILRSFYANGVFVHNSEHVPIMFLDEVDVVRDPQAYDEAKMIPGMERGVYPITVKLSTRKFAFGMMQRELDLAATTGEVIKRWNILDITEKCPPERHKPNEDGSKVDIYVHKRLPLRSSFEEEYQALPEAQKADWEKVNVHPGCVKCPLVAVCKGKLADKPDTAKSTKYILYKPIKSVINNFKKIPPDMAEAQLMCWRPSTKGLIYPRFEPTQQKGNLVSIPKAWEIITGDKKDDVNLTELVSMLHDTEARFYAGVDWGYTHESTIVVMAVTASGYSFIIDTYGSPGLEIHEFVEICASYQERYNIGRWFCDNAAPANIKALKKRLKMVSPHVMVPDFKKDVLAGIEAIRSQIVTSTGSRRLLVLDTPENQKIIQGFKVHHFKLDMAGNPTTTPDDEEYADIMDALRYIGQNVFSTGAQKPLTGQDISSNKDVIKAAQGDPKLAYVAQNVNNELMKQEVLKRVTQPSSHVDDNIKKNRKIFWNTE
jgi:hypothetical protein